MDDFLQRISAQLQLPLPGAAAQRLMEPELAYGRHAGPPRPDATPAAVVAMLYESSGDWKLPLMRRPESLTHHGGQISLPGGIVDVGESSEEAALRELEEELGITRFGVLLLGQLSPLYLFGSNFLITPWVAAVRAEVKFQPNAAEVEEVLEMPVFDLTNPLLRGEHIEQRGTVRLQAPHYHWRGFTIWGATSMILAELTCVIEPILRPHD